jgi:hypothetical protein
MLPGRPASTEGSAPGRFTEHSETARPPVRAYQISNEKRASPRWAFIAHRCAWRRQPNTFALRPRPPKLAGRGDGTENGCGGAMPTTTNIRDGWGGEPQRGIM